MPRLLLNFTNEVPEAGRIPRAAFLGLAQKAISKYKNLPHARFLAVAFVSPARSRELNARYRGRKKPTNVLSFSPISDAGELGDIIICPDYARREAGGLGVGINQWLSYLFVHGLLHLLDFDHKTKKQEKKMEKAAQQILRDAYVYFDQKIY